MVKMWRCECSYATGNGSNMRRHRSSCIARPVILALQAEIRALRNREAAVAAAAASAAAAAAASAAEAGPMIVRGSLTPPPAPARLPGARAVSPAPEEAEPAARLPGARAVSPAPEDAEPAARLPGARAVSPAPQEAEPAARRLPGARAVSPAPEEAEPAAEEEATVEVSVIDQIISHRVDDDGATWFEVQYTGSAQSKVIEKSEMVGYEQLIESYMTLIRRLALNTFAVKPRRRK
ncbi:hypothetical protein T492DRAFT_1006465 [Pavlovales sp. CCMP2436]|nr:hypothetical protein T492DRAFT_1006465 [Pavlovales sp. CCMP2436]